MLLVGYDLFHTGHVNLLKHAKEQCDWLILGINSDEEIYKYKHRYPIINEEDRRIVTAACRYVDECHIIETRDRTELYNLYHFNKLFVGSDWKNTDAWKQIEQDMNKLGVQVIYLPHTDGISTTDIRKIIKGQEDGEKQKTR